MAHVHLRRAVPHLAVKRVELRFLIRRQDRGEFLMRGFVRGLHLLFDCARGEELFADGGGVRIRRRRQRLQLPVGRLELLEQRPDAGFQLLVDAVELHFLVDAEAECGGDLLVADAAASDRLRARAARPTFS